MKELTRTSRTAGALEKIFRAVNQDLFNGEVEEPVITIQSTPTAYGHCSVMKTWTVKEDRRHELNISADYLTRPIENTVATMIHEMTHLLNLQRGVKDTSRGYSYHNKRFKEEAEKHLIKIDYDQRIGWSVTSPTEKLIDYIINKGFEDILMSHGKGLVSGYNGGTGGTGNGGNGLTVGPKKSSTRKLQCPKCGNSVRATKAVNILCGDCMERMTEV